MDSSRRKVTGRLDISNKYTTGSRPLKARVDLDAIIASSPVAEGRGLLSPSTPTSNVVKAKVTSGKAKVANFGSSSQVVSAGSIGGYAGGSRGSVGTVRSTSPSRSMVSSRSTGSSYTSDFSPGSPPRHLPQVQEHFASLGESSSAPPTGHVTPVGHEYLGNFHSISQSPLPSSLGRSTSTSSGSSSVSARLNNYTLSTQTFNSVNVSSRVSSPPMSQSKYYPHPPALPMPTPDTPPLRSQQPVIRHSRSQSEATSSSPTSNSRRESLDDEHCHPAPSISRPKSISHILEDDDEFEICKVCRGAGRRPRGVEEMEMQRENRKILDLEISNTSLLAINAALERSKRKQQTEIRELRRRLREGEIDPALIPVPPSEDSGSELDGPEDEEKENGEREPHWADLLKSDDKFKSIVVVVEMMLRRGREAVEAKADFESSGLGGGAKVLSPDFLEEREEERRRVGSSWDLNMALEGGEDSMEDLTMLPSSRPMTQRAKQNSVPSISLSRPSSRLSHLPDPDSLSPHAFGSSSAPSSEDEDEDIQANRRSTMIIHDDLPSLVSAPRRKVLKTNGNANSKASSRSTTPTTRRVQTNRLARSPSSPAISRAPSPHRQMIPSSRSRPLTPTPSSTLSVKMSSSTISPSPLNSKPTTRPTSPTKRMTTPNTRARPLSKSISGTSPIKRPMSPLKRSIASADDKEDDDDDMVLVEKGSPIKSPTTLDSTIGSNSMLHWAKSALERVA